MAQVQSSKPRRLLKRLLIAVALLVVLFVGLKIWFVHNARSVLKDYITEQSKGKIRLELSGLHLSLLEKSLQINEADLLSTDSLHEPITYHVTFSSLSLKVGSVWALLFQKKLLLDSLKLNDPVIQVIQWRKDTSQSIVKDELSIPQEMGKVYNSIQNALSEFSVRRIVLDNASISLINKIKPGSETVTVSNIFFNLVRTPVQKGKNIIYNSKDQTIELKTTHQNIRMPGGRHRLSFKSFNLKLYRQSVELDSCTITAISTDSSKSNYQIFFKKLFLTGVDFAALSTQNLIKADTVFCENPYFDFNIYRSEAVGKKNGTPDPGKIIQALSGNLNLGYVGVKNAGIHFDIYGETKRSFFNSYKDNFEMKSLRINPDSSEPVSVARFDMILRDYHLYNEDSSSELSFDSLHFINKKIVLNNFGMHIKPGKNMLQNNIDIKVPYFQLTGLNWYQLIFDQKMVAKDAVLNNPAINFTRRKTSTATRGRKFDLFDALLSVDSLVALENVLVTNGQMNMKLGPSTSFNVQNLDFKIYSNQLLGSTTKEGLRNAVDNLSFSKGVLRLKDITAQLQNARFTHDNKVYADKVFVSSLGNKIVGTVNKVYINNLQLDDGADVIEVDDMGWQSASVALKALPKGNNGNSNGSTIHLRNINGNNTRLSIVTGPIQISTVVQTLTATSILKGDGLVRVEGFNLVGSNLLLNSKSVKLNADSYNVTGTDASSLTGVEVKQIKGRDSVSIQASQVDFSTDLNELFENNLQLDYVRATAPVISIVKWDTATARPDTSGEQLPVRINSLIATSPSIFIAAHRNDSVTVISIPRSDNSLVKAGNIIMSDGGMQIGSLVVNTTAATYTRSGGEVLGIDKGKIDLDLSDIKFGKQNGKMNWSGLINNLNVQNANGLQMGKAKNNLRFQEASLGNLSLSSESLPRFGQLMKQNVSAWLRIPRGQFVDSNTTLNWYNADYNNTTRTLNLDSFVYHPTQPVDSAVARAPYQFDYITLRTGAIAISGLDVEQFEKDSSFIANTITVSHPVLTVYRDKQPPTKPIRTSKPLPVDLIKNISLPVSIQKLLLDSGTITYSEKNGKSRKQGDLVLSNVSGTLANIKNRDLQETDSLQLTFNARLLDAADLQLTLHESYFDSLSGFLLKAAIGSADLALANAFTVPLVNVKFSSGTLDSVSFWAIGRQDVAAGEMDMHYRKVRIQLVKNGDPNESTFLQNVISFIANTFIIKSNNTKRKGLIYFKHEDDQSFVNYIVRITMSGVISSVGVISNRKYRKQYQKQLKESGMREVKGFKL